MSTKKEREKRREERLQEESKVSTGDRRTKMLQLGAGVAFLAIVAVVVLIVANSGGDSGGDAENLQEVAAAESVVNGIEQNGMVLGDPNAKVELIEYGDMQCPVCKAYSEEVLPQVIENQVRTGKAKMVFHNFTIIGPQSKPAGAAVLAAGEQGRGVAALYEDFNAVIMRLVGIVMTLAPYGVFALVAGMAATRAKTP